MLSKEDESNLKEGDSGVGLLLVFAMFLLITLILMAFDMSKNEMSLPFYSYENVYIDEVVTGEPFPTDKAREDSYVYGGVVEDSENGYRVLLNTPDGVVYKKVKSGDTLLKLEEDRYPFYTAEYKVEEVKDNSIVVKALKRVDFDTSVEKDTVKSELITLKKGKVLLSKFNKEQAKAYLSTPHGFVLNGYTVKVYEATKNDLIMDVEVILSPNWYLDDNKTYTHTKTVKVKKGEVVKELTTIDTKKAYTFTYEGLVDGEPLIEASTYDLTNAKP